MPATLTCRRRLCNRARKVRAGASFQRGPERHHVVVGEVHDGDVAARRPRNDLPVQRNQVHFRVLREQPFANLAKALKPQGRLGIVDFRLDGTGPGPAPEERVSPDVVVNDATKAGLKLIRQEPFLPYQYFLIFGK